SCWRGSRSQPEFFSMTCKAHLRPAAADIISADGQQITAPFERRLAFLMMRLQDLSAKSRNSHPKPGSFRFGPVNAKKWMRKRSAPESIVSRGLVGGNLLLNSRLWPRLQKRLEHCSLTRRFSAISLSTVRRRVGLAMHLIRFRECPCA